MTDKELLILIRAQLLAGLGRQGDTTTEVIASHQPRSQGRVDGPALYVYKLMDHRYGWQHRKQEYDAESGDISVTEKQYMETSFQVTALYPQDPADTTGPTASDLASLAAMIVGSMTFGEAMKSQGAGVQRVMDILNPYFDNDRGQFEASPSFDFTVSHKRIMVDTAHAVDAAELNQTRV